jgi:hypothetical protein
MTWNYRVMYFPDAQEPYYAIHEVHYNADGSLSAYAENPAVVMWDLDEGFSDGVTVLAKMQAAFEKPVLQPDSFGVSHG